jgi:hypothetical protein
VESNERRDWGMTPPGMQGFSFTGKHPGLNLIR